VKRLWALLGSAIFLVIAPGTIAGYVPWSITGWHGSDQFGFPGAKPFGVVLLAAGLLALLNSFARFALQGLGTPAPIAPPERLVVTGLYRHVRNPMYVAVLAIIVGQALMLSDARLLVWAAAVWLLFHLFVIFYEEPTLKRTFDAEYDRFRANVPRWLPRWTPWKGQSD
jgi:protein-S-isoprenylcysteine O-methyltransferase Ste14